MNKDDEPNGREVIAGRLAERHAAIAGKIEPNPAQLELNVVEARAHFMDAVIVMGNLRANEITNNNPVVLPGLRAQVQVAMEDCARAEMALAEAVKELTEARTAPKLIVIEGGK